MKKFNAEPILKIRPIRSRSEPICKTWCKEEKETISVYTVERKVLDPCDAYVNHEYIFICWEQDLAKPASYAGFM